MLRDFTYVDDIVEGHTRVNDNPPKENPNWIEECGDSSRSKAFYKVCNIGNSNPVKLMDFITAIEIALEKEAIKNFLPLQAGDVPSNYANVDDLVEDMGYIPETSIEFGIENFISWYRSFNNC